MRLDETRTARRDLPRREEHGFLAIPAIICNYIGRKGIDGFVNEESYGKGKVSLNGLLRGGGIYCFFVEVLLHT